MTGWRVFRQLLSGRVVRIRQELISRSQCDSQSVCREVDGGARSWMWSIEPLDPHEDAEQRVLDKVFGLVSISSVEQ